MDFIVVFLSLSLWREKKSISSRGLPYFEKDPSPSAALVFTAVALQKLVLSESGIGPARFGFFADLSGYGATLIWIEAHDYGEALGARIQIVSVVA